MIESPASPRVCGAALRVRVAFMIEFLLGLTFVCQCFLLALSGAFALKENQRELAVILLTVLLSAFATQALVPSKMITCGSSPTSKV